MNISDLNLWKKDEDNDIYKRSIEIDIEEETDYLISFNKSNPSSFLEVTEIDEKNNLIIKTFRIGEYKTDKIKYVFTTLPKVSKIKIYLTYDEKYYSDISIKEVVLIEKIEKK